MEKYTNLEEAVRDPSLVIITDQISTQTELNRAFIKYKTLPKKQRRYSNYYSNEFLGHTVPDMYILVREKLIADNISMKELQLPKVFQHIKEQFQVIQVLQLYLSA